MYFIIIIVSVPVPHTCICVKEAHHQFVCIMTNKEYRIMYNKQHTYNNCSTIVIFFTTNKLAIASIHGKYVCMYR